MGHRLLDIMIKLQIYTVYLRIHTMEHWVSFSIVYRDFRNRFEENVLTENITSGAPSKKMVEWGRLR